MSLCIRDSSKGCRHLCTWVINAVVVVGVGSLAGGFIIKPQELQCLVQHCCQDKFMSRLASLALPCHEDAAVCALQPCNTAYTFLCSVSKGKAAGALKEAPCIGGRFSRVEQVVQPGSWWGGAWRLKQAQGNWFF